MAEPAETERKLRARNQALIAIGDNKARFKKLQENEPLKTAYGEYQELCDDVAAFENELIRRFGDKKKMTYKKWIDDPDAAKKWPNIVDVKIGGESMALPAKIYEPARMESMRGHRNQALGNALKIKDDVLKELVPYSERDAEAVRDALWNEYVDRKTEENTPKPIPYAIDLPPPDITPQLPKAPMPRVASWKH